MRTAQSQSNVLPLEIIKYTALYYKKLIEQNWNLTSSTLVNVTSIQLSGNIQINICRVTDIIQKAEREKKNSAIIFSWFMWDLLSLPSKRKVLTLTWINNTWVFKRISMIFCKELIELFVYYFKMFSKKDDYLLFSCLSLWIH